MYDPPRFLCSKQATPPAGPARKPNTAQHNTKLPSTGLRSSAVHPLLTNYPLQNGPAPTTTGPQLPYTPPTYSHHPLDWTRPDWTAPHPRRPKNTLSSEIRLHARLDVKQRQLRSDPAAAYPAPLRWSLGDDGRWWRWEAVGTVGREAVSLIGRGGGGWVDRSKVGVSGC